jgi:hypothetical protein
MKRKRAVLRSRIAFVHEFLVVGVAPAYWQVVLSDNAAASESFITLADIP